MFHGEQSHALDTPVKTGETFGMPETTPTVTLAGAADILGVSRQWAHELSQRDGFPTPVLVTDLGRRWAKSEIEAYAAERRTDA